MSLLKKTIWLIAGIIIVLNNGQTLEFEGACYGIGSNSALLIVYCEDYDSKGFDNPAIFAVNRDQVKSYSLTK